MKSVLSLGILCLGFGFAFSATATTVAVGTEIEITRPIKVIRDNYLKLDTMAIVGVAMQRGTMLENHELTLERLDSGVCLLAPVPTAGLTEAFTIPPQVILFSKVENERLATATVIDSERQKRTVTIGCDCNFDHDTLLTAKCLRVGFQPLGYAATLALTPEPKLNGGNGASTQVKLVVPSKDN